jgi:midasin
VQLAFAPLTPARPPLHSVFSLTRHTAVLLEAVAMALVREESLLLVGETGVGKTTAVQFLAERTGMRLRVVNLNQQS